MAELYHHGWHGVAVELEARFCSELENNLVDSEGVTIHCPVPATPLNIETLLKVTIKMTTPCISHNTVHLVGISEGYGLLEDRH